MSKAKFTKGEWVAFKEDSLEHSNYEVITIGDEGYCLVAHGVLEHDANLIAAAPEMYKEIERDIEILKDIKEELQIGNYRQNIINRIEHKQKLLAKARGE